MSFILQSRLNSVKPNIKINELSNYHRWKFVWIRIKYLFLVRLGLLFLVLPSIYAYVKYYFRGYTFIDKHVSDASDAKAAVATSSDIKFKLLFFELIWLMPLGALSYVTAKIFSLSQLPNYLQPITLITLLFYFPL